MVIKQLQQDVPLPQPVFLVLPTQSSNGYAPTVQYRLVDTSPYLTSTKYSLPYTPNDNAQYHQSLPLVQSHWLQYLLAFDANSQLIPVLYHGFAS
jgi:hypothetical protein